MGKPVGGGDGEGEQMPAVVLLGRSGGDNTRMGEEIGTGRLAMVSVGEYDCDRGNARPSLTVTTVSPSSSALKGCRCC
jgi:hypothetical protein